MEITGRLGPIVALLSIGLKQLKIILVHIHASLMLQLLARAPTPLQNPICVYSFELRDIPD